jgi:hypothetical protein
MTPEDRAQAIVNDLQTLAGWNGCSAESWLEVIQKGIEADRAETWEVCAEFFAPDDDAIRGD